MDITSFKDPRTHGFVRVAGAVPIVYLADPERNADECIDMVKEADDLGVEYLQFPELSLTGYSCGDLFQNEVLISGALGALERVMLSTSRYKTLITVGLPLLVEGDLYNAAVTLMGGKPLAISVKSYLPNYREFYEARHFATASHLRVSEVDLFGHRVPIGNDILIASDKREHFIVHTEICEDGWVPVSPSDLAGLSGATILANLSASNITIGKADFRRLLMQSSSGKSLAVRMYTSAGYGESTTDHAWDGQVIIAERGTVVAESERFSLESHLTVHDVDCALMVRERMVQTSIRDNARAVLSDNTFRRVVFKDPYLDRPMEGFYRSVERNPFVPSDPALRSERCEETFLIQVTSLARRLIHLSEGHRKLVLGVSGGLDSTHALLVAVRAMDLLELPRANIVGITMPGFGTTDRTRENAKKLMEVLGVTAYDRDIEDLAGLLFRKVGHDGEKKDLTFENTQSWSRKVLELVTNNHEGGLVLGTGDLSELAIGWCTMFGDHASHYNVNAGVPKTLIQYLVQWTIDCVFEGDSDVAEVLADILATPISPELLPAGDEGEIKQRTEDIVGPNDLRDFFLYYMLRFGFGPKKVAFLASHAYEDMELEEIVRWLRIFIGRFFRAQFKRSVMPDGPKVGLTCLSPRGDWRMPSDVDGRLWLEAVESIPTPST